MIASWQCSESGRDWLATGLALAMRDTLTQSAPLLRCYPRSIHAGEQKPGGWLSCIGNIACHPFPLHPSSLLIKLLPVVDVEQLRTCASKCGANLIADS